MMDFQPGDIQRLSNLVVRHARTAYVDHKEPERKRHLLRLWLSLPQGAPLNDRPARLREAARRLYVMARGRLIARRSRPGSAG